MATSFSIAIFSPTLITHPKKYLSPLHTASYRPCYSKLAVAAISQVHPPTLTSPPTIERRSANYHPSIWDPKAIQSLNTPYTYEIHATRLEELKQEILRSLELYKGIPCAQLKLIDSMQRLGVGYHFEEEIKEILSLVKLDINGDLYTTALHFRLLRQHAFPVSSDVFDKFRDQNGKFKDVLAKDVEGILSLYDASYLGMHGEDVLEEAKSFTTQHLKPLLEKLEKNNNFRQQVEQALDVPLHWRMRRLEHRNFINIYQKDDTHNKSLLELAVLDYNLVQSVYQKELKELISWWQKLDFTNKLEFSRDRLVENYLWALGSIYEPQYSKCRIIATQFSCILSAIDDMYDIYGSLDEVELFTEAVERWDIKNMEKLPEYMKILYSSLLDFGYDFAYNVLNEDDLDALPHIKFEWARLCRSYLLEAKWFHNKYTPTFDEYIKNAWISIGGHEAIVHAAMFLGHDLSRDLLERLKNGNEPITYWSSLITRLKDDLGTTQAEMERGDVTKSIQCYMIDNDASEEEARNYVRKVVNNAWKNLNEESTKTALPRFLVDMSLNMARTAQTIFEHGDGIGTSIGVTQNHLISLIVQPIQL